MSNGTHEDPIPGPQQPRGWTRGVPRGWSWGTPVVLGVCGILLITSAEVSDGNDLRPSRLTDIASTVKADRATADQLTARVAELNGEVKELTESTSSSVLDPWKKRADELAGPAGATEVTGSGVVVELDDAPETVTGENADNDNELVVHQQDLQGVINALWNGGAEAITLMGQRIVSTTGIKCEGNVVTLHGLNYSPPYRIEAIGDPAALEAALDADVVVQAFIAAALDPDIQVQWSEEVGHDLVAKPYEGLSALQYATPLDNQE